MELQYRYFFINRSITKDNKGFKLLSKMGWSEGRSLGKDGDGRTEPVSALFIALLFIRIEKICM